MLAMALGLGGLGLGYWAARGRTTSPATPPPDAPYRAVVALEAHMTDGTTHWASGSIVSPDGLILTCAHAVWPADQAVPPARIVVHTIDAVDRPPRPRYEARIVQLDVTLDLAVLRVVANAQGQPVDSASLHLPSLPLGDPEALTLGDPLTVLGYPNIGGATLTLTQGVVAGFRGQEPYGPRAWIKTTAAVARGSSGGAVLDRSGHLVAVPVQVGAGEGAPVADCRVLTDTNHDGVVGPDDSCIPVGGFLNALRPVSLAQPLIDAARAGHERVPTPRPTPTLPPAPQADLVLAHDTLVTPRWPWVFETDAGWSRFAHGVLWVHLNAATYTHAFVLEMRPQDVEVQARFRVQQPVPGGYLGLTCRYQDGQNFYAFLLRADGQLAIVRYQEGRERILWPWSAVTDPLQPGQREDLTIQCQGPYLRFWRAGQLVAQTQDPALTQGDVGFLFGTWGQGGWVAGLDEYWVRMLPAAQAR